jgi:hypothetical protein
MRERDVSVGSGDFSNITGWDGGAGLIHRGIVAGAKGAASGIKTGAKGALHGLRMATWPLQGETWRHENINVWETRLMTPKEYTDARRTKRVSEGESPTVRSYWKGASDEGQPGGRSLSSVKRIPLSRYTSGEYRSEDDFRAADVSMIPDVSAAVTPKPESLDKHRTRGQVTKDKKTDIQTFY